MKKIVTLILLQTSWLITIAQSKSFEGTVVYKTEVKSKEEGTGETGTKGGEGPKSKGQTGKPGTEEGPGSSQKPGEKGTKPEGGKPGAGEGSQGGPPKNLERDPSKPDVLADILRRHAPAAK